MLDPGGCSTTIKDAFLFELAEASHLPRLESLSLRGSTKLPPPVSAGSRTAAGEPSSPLNLNGCERVDMILSARPSLRE